MGNPQGLKGPPYKCRTLNKAPRLIGAHCSIAGGIHQAPRRGAVLGCTVIQLFTKNNNQWGAAPLTSEEIDAFHEEMRKGGIKLAFAHTGYLINLASPDPVRHEQSVISMLNELERAETLGLPYLVVHPGSHKGAGELVGILQVVSALKQLINETAGFRVKIVLETTAGQGRSIGYRFEHFSEIFSRLSKPARIGVCVDTAHIFEAGYDIRTKKTYEHTWREFRRNIDIEFLKVIHVNDSARELGSRVDRHEHIGKGHIGIEPFKWLLNDPRFFHLPMVIETPKGTTLREDRRNLKLLWRMIKT